MDRYYIDDRILPSLRGALDEDIELGMYTGSFLASAKSVSRKLETTYRPSLSLEEWNFLRSYVQELVGQEPRSGSYETGIAQERMLQEEKKLYGPEVVESFRLQEEARAFDTGEDDEEDY